LVNKKYKTMNDLKKIGNSALAFIFIAGAFSCQSNRQNAVNVEVKPNLILILTDDQGYSDLGIYGAEGFSTPNIDQMAREGVRFTSFYAAPTCSPSRASLLTGCYSQRVGIGGPVNHPFTGLNPDEITLAEALKLNGYSTALIGKWHLGLPDSMSPCNQGFDYFSGIPLSHIRHGVTEHTDGPTAYYTRHWRTEISGSEPLIENYPNDTLFTQRCTEEALNFIKENKNNPFFLFLSHPQVHREVLASDKFRGKTERGRYGDACEELDWSVGEVLKALKDLDIDDNTLVIYASDNGPWLNMGDESGTSKNLRDGKFSTWEGGLRVPCIMRWPGQIPEDKIINEMAAIMDIYPTFMHLLGKEMPNDRVIDGKNIWPLITSTSPVKTPHETFFYHNYLRLEGVRKGPWKLHFDMGKWELFNLDDDLGETKDIAGNHPDIVTELHALLDSSRYDMGDALMQIQGKNVRPIGKVEVE
jgi:arylsulfatase A